MPWKNEIWSHIYTRLCWMKVALPFTKTVRRGVLGFEKLVGREAAGSEIDNWQQPYEKPQV